MKKRWGPVKPSRDRRFLPAERLQVSAVGDGDPGEVADVLAEGQLPVHVDLGQRGAW
jgi:hypothetical protein